MSFRSKKIGYKAVRWSKIKFRLITGFLCAIFILSCFLSCESPQKQFDTNAYQAHIELPSSTLIVTEIARDLEVPWDLVTSVPGWIWFTEQKGTISRVNIETGTIERLLQLEDVFYRKSTGLLSMVLHPNFEQNPFVYLHYTYAEADDNFKDQIASKIVRFTFKNGTLGDAFTVLDNIPGNTYHNGSRMLITDDLKLWIGTGDAGKTNLTQDWNTHHGKILRMQLDGSVPPDNPNPNSLVWSTGHRNIQGITYGNNHVYAAEHGPNNDDEVNLVVKGGNYGWPNVEGFCDLEREKAYCKDSTIVEPLRAWTPTVAAAGLEYYAASTIPEWSNSLLLANLKGQSIRILHLNDQGESVESEQIYFYKQFGRIRDIAVGSEGEIYLATSNLDWHPGHQPWMYDGLPTKKGDRILKIEMANPTMIRQLATINNPLELQENKEIADLPTENFNFNATSEALQKGQKLYIAHCASCHRPDGEGNIGQIPPLVNSEWVSGNISRLIDVTLKGLNTPITVNGIQYEGEMPSYRNLEDGEITDILNYIRIEFGEAKGNIVPADVMHQRKGLN